MTYCKRHRFHRDRWIPATAHATTSGCLVDSEWRTVDPPWRNLSCGTFRTVKTQRTQVVGGHMSGSMKVMTSRLRTVCRPSSGECVRLTLYDRLTLGQKRPRNSCQNIV